MELEKIGIYNPVTKNVFEQYNLPEIRSAVEAIYLELNNNFEALFKRKELLSLAPIGLIDFTMEITGYEGTGIYKIFYRDNLVVLGEVFTDNLEIDKFFENLVVELKNLYREIPEAPVITINFTKEFYKLEKNNQDMVFSYCRLLGFSTVKVLENHRKIVVN
ncbi:hypothetical protein [Fusobacterium sp. SYSU M8D902]|uniref:hypothetical protein n=1 Tax=Fusobacterium sp. SYSU M8D902 TaxID=3159562 RepID=UPI0032E42366